ncbi:hypothetical protein C5B96_14930, partial [Subtercola sp. Z020]|uniref:DUF1697 domain-containing protein n=1 Tax=Subtercola sp. Z020 TaxID=2080582 RepID=UPI000D49F37C
MSRAGAAGAGSAVGSHEYVGLVRGINVGANNRITMADFRRVFERLGYTDVATLLQSGNVVFASDRLLGAPDVAAIESAFAAAAGFRASFVVLSAAQFEATVTANPLLPPATCHCRFSVTVSSMRRSWVT